MVNRRRYLNLLSQNTLRNTAKHYGVIAKNIFHNPFDIKYLKFPKNVKKNGIIIVIHESNRLGASLLVERIAEEMIRQGENVFIITKQFGELNNEYIRIAPTEIVFSKNSFKKVILKLKNEYEYKRILMVTVSVGDLTKVAHDCGYKIVSTIHELAYVVQYLHKEEMTKEMLEYSNYTVFSTNIAKNEVLNLLNYYDDSNVLVKPQGVYYQKPNEKVIDIERKKIISKFPVLLNHPIIIGVGNTSARKGFDIFLKVADLLQEYIFLWAGKKENYFKQIIDKRGNKLPDNFVYVGSLNPNELAAIYDIGDVLLMSSRKDTLPSVIFESLLFGVPVVGAKDSGGITDIITPSCGVLTDTCSADEFAKAINAIINGTLTFDAKDLIKTAKKNKFDNYISFLISLFEKR